MKIVVIGLTLSSSWGNGHATTYRALLRALAARGHEILFLECDRPWYAAHRDLAKPNFCALKLYDNVSELTQYNRNLQKADLVIIGSYVVDGVQVAHAVRQQCKLLAFYDIDTPVTLARLEAGVAEYVTPEVIPLYDIYFSFTGGPVLRQLEIGYGARNVHQLFCAADPELYAPQPLLQPPRWDLGYLGTYSVDRQPALERLLLEPARRAPHRRFVVAGAQYPGDISWPANVERIEHLDPAEHAAFYNSQVWTLNITREDMKRAGYSPSVRLFEAAGCATPVISDLWPGLNDIFQIGTEIDVARDGHDVLAILDKPREVATEMGRAAHRRFLAEHTPAERAQSVEAVVKTLSEPHTKGGSGGRRCLQRMA